MAEKVTFLTIRAPKNPNEQFTNPHDRIRIRTKTFPASFMVQKKPNTKTGQSPKLKIPTMSSFASTTSACAEAM